MLGAIMVAEVREATVFTGQFAAYTISGSMPVQVNGKGRFDATNEEARAQCQRAAIDALSAAGVVAVVEAHP